MTYHYRPGDRVAAYIPATDATEIIQLVEDNGDGTWETVVIDVPAFPGPIDVWTKDFQPLKYYRGSAFNES